MGPDKTSEHVFTTTHWSMVLRAQGTDSTPADEALATLCETYWYPLYAFVRRRGNSSHDAQDLTQAFFEKLLEKNFLGNVAQEKGRFRSFLLGALKHFLANEWHRSQAAKRGGGMVSVSLDDADARYQLEPADTMTAEKLFERRWALTLLDQVLKRLRDEMESAGKGTQFDALKDSITAGKDAASFAEVGKKLDMAEGTARVAAHRLKKRYREILRDEISQTVAESSDVDAEIRHLISILSGREK